jgi:hypothetical protein
MATLTIPTPEGPFESIAFLGDRMDWAAWLDDVTTISKALDIWLYVNPDGKDFLNLPDEPSAPSRPKLPPFPSREPYETDKVYDLRVEQERNSQSLSVREFDVFYEQYRMDTAGYLASLAVYTAAKDDLQRLFRIIYRSIPDRYRAYLRLDGADTPRDMIRCLRSRISPPSDKERAPIAQRQLDMKLKVQPTDDKQDFIEEIALAAAELHRLKSSTFDEATAARELIASLQALDRPFADSLSRKGAGKGADSVLSIVEEFKYRMRMQDDKPYLKEVPDAAIAPATISSNRVGEEETLISLAQDDQPLDLYPAVKRNGVETPTPPKKANKVKQAKQDAILDGQQHYSSRKSEREPSFNEKSPKSRTAASEFVPAEKPWRPRNGVSDHPPSERPSKSKRKSESQGAMVMRICPGCELRHLIRGDAWWESCFVYFELAGLGNVPEHFTVSVRKLDLAYSRLDDHPDEERRAQEWSKKKKPRTNGVAATEDEEFSLW